MQHNIGMWFFGLNEKTPEPAFRFEGGEIVRLKQDSPDTVVKAGDWGVVWGIYGHGWYEASFFGWDGRYDDVVFEEHEVEEVIDALPESYPKELENLRRWLAGGQK